MRVLRGRAEDPEADHRRSREIAQRVAETGEPAVRVWRPHRQVAFGRRDARTDGYEAARAAAASRGYPAVEREVGGRAVAYTGDELAFSLAEPVEDGRSGIQDRYDAALDALAGALADCGVDAERGEPPDSFCPGSHSLRVDDGKIAGVAQRVRSGVAVVGGIVVGDAECFVDVVGPVYDALGAAFDPRSVGGVTGTGGEVDGVRDAVEAALVDGRPVTASPVRDT